MAVTEYIRNVDRAILNTVLGTQFGEVINVCRLAGEHFERYFLYCNHQMHRLFDHPVCTLPVLTNLRPQDSILHLEGAHAHWADVCLRRARRP
jgi:hypothetical protein